MRNECNFSVTTKEEMDKLIIYMNWQGVCHILLHQVMSKGNPNGIQPFVESFMVKLTFIDRYGKEISEKKDYI